MKAIRHVASVRLEELRPFLQRWANDIDRSENWIMRKILREALIRERGIKKEDLDKLRGQLKLKKT